jgi:LysW-gamma-L-lysine carboxypeptidase
MRHESGVDLLERMLAIPSLSGEEGDLAVFLAGAMERLGLAARIDEVGNVIGRTGRGDGPTILLLGHLDTVPGDLPVRRTGHALHGRGAVDAKGPLAAMVTAAATADLPGRLIVVGAVEEETPGSRGAVHIRRTLPQPDLVIIGEPSGWQGVTIGYKGKLDLRYRVSRPATHSSNPAEKATEAAAAFWQDAVRAAGPEASHARFDRAGVTLESMAGTMSNAVLRFSYRTPVAFDEPALLERLRQVARGGDLEVLNTVAAVRSHTGDPVVRALSMAIRDNGGTPRRRLKTATSDMNTLAQAWRVPMATYGPGDSHLDHSDDEHILIEDYHRAVAVLRGALAELAGPPR